MAFILSVPLIFAMAFATSEGHSTVGEFIIGVFLAFIFVEISEINSKHDNTRD